VTDFRQLETYYGLSYTIVSLVFLSPLLGYSASALLNDRIHLSLGQRGIAVICSLCHMAAYIVASVHPPYPVLVIIYVLAGLGNGLEDAAWNAWIGDMANSNEVMGFLHGCYGLGATIAPLIATSMITKAGLPWWTFYYMMVGFAALELVAGAWAFWDETGEEFRRKHPRTTEHGGARMKEAIWTMPAARTTWTVTAFLFIYMGVEVGIGGWIVTFMIKVRNGSPFAGGMTATGFWLGLTVGRVVLGFVTPKIGEKLAVLVS
jgi:fucose permease